jgi:hypothetical protein
MLQSCDNAAPKWRAAVAYAGALNRYYKQLVIATIVPVVLTQGSTDFRTLDMPKVLKYSAKVHVLYIHGIFEYFAEKVKKGQNRSKQPEPMGLTDHEVAGRLQNI